MKWGRRELRTTRTLCGCTHELQYHFEGKVKNHAAVTILIALLDAHVPGVDTPWDEPPVDISHCRVDGCTCPKFESDNLAYLVMLSEAK